MTESEFNKYQHLAPVTDVQLSDAYTSAFEYALSNEHVKNIAVSGPYGSGKSSVIRSYANLRNKKFLVISLAAFNVNGCVGQDESNSETNDSETNDNETLARNVRELVQRSIVQQIIYGEDANQLTFSRFSKIKKPALLDLRAIMIVCWVILALYFFNDSKLLKIPDSIYYHWSTSLLTSVIFLALSFVLLSGFFQNTLGFSLKKISIPGFSVDSEDHKTETIFDNHLDELIYFFSETDGKYDAVVFEDLDRFRDTEIFVELRELNKIINDNPGAKKQIKFIYALRDDLFKNNDRTKFFDFIIPIIPVVNWTNSLNKMRERVKTKIQEEDIDERLLQDISLYLTDMRLIHNIFNEFEIYAQKLDSPGLNLSNLLAAIVYKNVYPHDFEKLHHKDGILFNLMADIKEKLKRQLSNSIEQELAKVQQAISISDAQLEKSKMELIKKYIYEIAISKNPNRHAGVWVSNKYCSFSDLEKVENFQELVGASNIEFSHVNGQRRNSNFSFADLESIVHPGQTFSEKESALTNKSNSKRSEFANRLKYLKAELSAINRLSLKALIKENDYALSAEIPLHQPELLAYLISYGYIDENYHMYISNFYEGVVSKNDNEFLRLVLGGGNANFDLKIENASEVIRRMRPENFGRDSALNLTLFDTLLDKPSDYRQELDAVFSLLRDDSENGGKFLSAFLSSDLGVEKLLQALCTNYQEYFRSLENESIFPELVSNLLHQKNAQHLTSAINSEGFLTNYLSQNKDGLFSIPDTRFADYYIFENLNVKFEEVEFFEGNEKLYQFIKDQKLYEMNLNNIVNLLHSNGIRVTNNSAILTLVMESEDEILKGYVSENITSFLDTVFFKNSNSDESEEVILWLLGHSDVSKKTASKIIGSHKNSFTDISNIEEFYWPQLISERKVYPSWENVLRILKRDDGNISDFVSLLEDEEFAAEISSYSIDSIQEQLPDLEQILIHVLRHESLSRDIKRKILKSANFIFVEFPDGTEVDEDMLLLDLGMIDLNDETLETYSGHPKTVATILETNFDKFINGSDGFDVSDQALLELVRRDIPVGNKLEIISNIPISSFEDDAHSATKAIEIYAANGIEVEDVDTDLVLLSIRQSKDVSFQIGTILKFESVLSGGQIESLIPYLPFEYRKIGQKGRYLKLKSNPENIRFAEILKAKGVISTFSITTLGRLRINNKVK